MVLLFLGITGLIAYTKYSEKSLIAPPQNAAELKHWQKPIQTPVTGNYGKKFKHGQLRFLAEFEVSGRVLGKKYYDDGRYGKIAPLDIAMGWRFMSNEKVFEQSKMHNHNRFFTWEGDLKLPRKEIVRNHANIHIIPANAEVWLALDKVQPKDLVTLKGYLANYDERIGNRLFMLRSSLTRSDEGPDSCELLYVTSVTPYH